MTKNITLLGADYANVPACELPVTGGGTALFFDTTDANASAADIASGKTAYVNNAKITGTFVSNIVHGEFTTRSTEGTQTLNIPYTGTGYPLIACVVVKTGAYNPTGAPAWYNSKQRYAVGVWECVKSDMTSTPTYTNDSASENYATCMAIYKNSTTNATSYTRTSSMQSPIYVLSTSEAINSATSCVRFKGNGTTLSVYVAGSSYGLLPGIDYEYFIVYSQ